MEKPFLLPFLPGCLPLLTQEDQSKMVSGVWKVEKIGEDLEYGTMRMGGIADHWKLSNQRHPNAINNQKQSRLSK